MFQQGTFVYVGYRPDSRVHPDARSHRCRIGQIEAGPFPASESTADGYIMSGPWYHVMIDGEAFDAATDILFPFDDPDTETETTEQGEVAV